MSALISVRLSDDIASTMQDQATALHISRTEYIRRAIVALNQATLQAIRKDKIVKASLRVRKYSMKVNAEFSEFEDDPESKKSR